MELREKIADVISEGRDRLIDRSSSEIADAILALPEIDPTPLDMRILAALGAVRDAMPPDDVTVVQKFARAIAGLRKQAPA